MKRRNEKYYLDNEGFKQVFNYFWKRIGGKNPEKYYEQIDDNYAGRAYHNLIHVKNLLMELYPCKDACREYRCDSTRNLVS